jgi:hypothetical protein
MKQHLESAAIALGIGVLGYIAYRSMKKPTASVAIAPATAPSNYLNADSYYTNQGTVSSAGILDARDAMAWGGRQIGSVQ